MFQQTLESDYSIAGADRNLFDRWEVPTPAFCGSQIPALWAEEEQGDEDKKTTQKVEAEKQKDKKRGQQDDRPQPPKNPKPRKKM